MSKHTKTSTKTGTTKTAASADAAPQALGPKTLPIPMGFAVLGSPEDEVGRVSDESQYAFATGGFLMDETQVTRAQWRAIMGTDPCAENHPQDAPVVNVSWYDAVRFCNKRSELEGLVPMYVITETNDPAAPDVKLVQTGYRLPTESEWEYACRADTTGPRYGELDEIAVYGRTDHAQPVKTKKPNAWGLYDMLGNAWEWCQDQYSADRSKKAEGDHKNRALADLDSLVKPK